MELSVWWNLESGCEDRMGRRENHRLGLQGRLPGQGQPRDLLTESGTHSLQTSHVAPAGDHKPRPSTTDNSCNYYKRSNSAVKKPGSVAAKWSKVTDVRLFHGKSTGERGTFST